MSHAPNKITMRTNDLDDIEFTDGKTSLTVRGILRLRVFLLVIAITQAFILWILQ